MEEEETNGSKSNGGGGQCAVATFVFSWVLLVLITALSLACTWAYSQQYDKSGTGLSVAAAILTSVAFCGATCGACGCGTGGSEAKMGIGFLWQCYHECDDDCDICVCFRLLALCGLTLIIVPCIIWNFPSHQWKSHVAQSCHKHSNQCEGVCRIYCCL